MRRSARTALVLTSLAVAGVALAPAAQAARAAEPAAPECAALGVVPDPACLVADEVEALLQPPAPAPAPAPAGESDGSSSGATTSDAQATSASPSTAASVSGGSSGSSAPTSPAPASRGSVPAVPEGSTLELSPLALPSFGLTGQPAVTADELAISDAVSKELVVPAARTAAELPDRSKTTAVVMAIGMLLLAGGLLLDQLRKARLPLPL